jgi:hypothetical protein
LPAPSGESNDRTGRSFRGSVAFSPTIRVLRCQGVPGAVLNGGVTMFPPQSEVIVLSSTSGLLLPIHWDDFAIGWEDPEPPVPPPRG